MDHLGGASRRCISAGISAMIRYGTAGSRDGLREGVPVVKREGEFSCQNLSHQHDMAKSCARMHAAPTSRGGLCMEEALEKPVIPSPCPVCPTGNEVRGPDDNKQW